MGVLAQMPADAIQALLSRAYPQIVATGSHPARPHLLGLDLAPAVERQPHRADTSLPAGLTAALDGSGRLGDRSPHAVPWRRRAARERDFEQHRVRGVQ